MDNNLNTLNKDVFLNEYHIKECFENSELEWNILEEIYMDYIQNLEQIKQCCELFEEYCQANFSSEKNLYHSIRCRHKDPKHLIEKIIRKRGKEQSAKYMNINADNYKDIIHDLVGLRILVVRKEDWESIFDEIVRIFQPDKGQNYYIVEEPIAYIRYGDCDIYKNKIKKEYSNKGYRSQHYIVWFNNSFCEIQVRTLAEEVYGEFDHLVKYPYRNDNNFLLRYTNTLSKLTNAIDEMMSTCFQMKENGWETNAVYFEKDCYENWTKTSQNTEFEMGVGYVTEQPVKSPSITAPINIKQHINEILLRKESLR